MQILQTSRQFLLLPVSDPRVEDLPPGSYTVEAALVPEDRDGPGEADWRPAQSLTVAGRTGTHWGILVTGADYERGDYCAYTRVTYGSAAPVELAARVHIGL